MDLRRDVGGGGFGSELVESGCGMVSDEQMALVGGCREGMRR